MVRTVEVLLLLLILVFVICAFMLVVYMCAAFVMVLSLGDVLICISVVHSTLFINRGRVIICR